MSSTAVKLPADDSAAGGWTPTGAATLAAALADASDLTYIVTTTEHDLFYCTVGDLPSDAVNVISVKARIRSAVSDESGCHMLVRSKIGADTEDSDELDVIAAAATSSYKSISCPGGGSWTVAKFNSATFGIYLSDLPDEATATVYLMDVQVVYETAGPQTLGGGSSNSGRSSYRIYLTRPTKRAKVRPKH